MKTFFITLSFFTILIAQKTVALFDLENNGLSESEVKLLTDRLQSELINVGGYRFVERSEIKGILNEQKLQYSGSVDAKTIIEVGNFIGAELIILGDIGKIGNYYTSSARLIDLKSSEIIKSANYDAGNSINDLHLNGMSSIAAQLLDSLKSNNKKIIKKAKKIIDKSIGNLENQKIKVLKIKTKTANDGTIRIYITFQQKVSYQPTIIMIDWLDFEGIPFDGGKKYTANNILKNEVRSIFFYMNNDAHDYRVRLK